MAFALTWLAETLENAGLKVAEVPGWRTRGRSEMGIVKGVMCHHTAGPATGNMPTLNLIINGRSDLPGPLSQLALGRDGTYYVVAAGRANHAGAGSWQGITTGNSSFIGIEAENTGLATDLWPPVQMQAYRHGVAAILRKIGAGAIMCCGHKEYAQPPGRKPDPIFDMNMFRSEIATILAGAAPLQLIPAQEPKPDNTGRPTLRRGATGPHVTAIQTKLKTEKVDGIFGSHTEAKVRAFQREKGIVPDGIIGPETWKQIDTIPA